MPLKTLLQKRLSQKVEAFFITVFYIVSTTMFRKLLKFPKHKRRLMKLNLVKKTSASLLRQPLLLIYTRIF